MVEEMMGEVWYNEKSLVRWEKCGMVRKVWYGRKSVVWW